MERKPVLKTLKQASTEAVSRLIFAARDNSSQKSYGKVARITNSKLRAREIVKATDRDIQKIGNFIFEHLPGDVIDDLVKMFCLTLSKFIKEQISHRTLAATDLDCFTCHHIIVSHRFVKICFHSQVPTLDLRWFDQAIQTMLFRTMSGCKNKKTINFSECYLPIPRTNFKNIIRNNFSTVRSLRIDFSVDNSILSAVGQTCHLLEHLELDQCLSLNNFGLVKLVHGCKNLKRLLLGSNTQITEDCVVHALLELPKLERFGRGAVPLISALKTIRAKYPQKILKLKSLETFHNEVITHNETALEVVTKTCPGLRNVKLAVFQPNLEPLSRLKHLTAIRLHGAGMGNHHKSLGNVLGTLGHQISLLELDTSSGISLSDLASIGHACKFLDTLILRNLQHLQQQSFPVSENRCIFPHLRILYFDPSRSECFAGSQILEFILTSAAVLEELYVENCLDISDELFTNVLSCDGLQLLRKLQVTSVASGPRIFDKLSLTTVLALMDRCKNLSEMGDLSKWAIEKKHAGDLEKLINQKNLDLKFSIESLFKFHEKYFYF